MLRRRFHYHCQSFMRRFFKYSAVKSDYLWKLLTFTKIKITFSMLLLRVLASAKLSSLSFCKIIVFKKEVPSIEVHCTKSHPFSYYSIHDRSSHLAISSLCLIKSKAFKKLVTNTLACSLCQMNRTLMRPKRMMEKERVG